MSRSFWIAFTVLSLTAVAGCKPVAQQQAAAAQALLETDRSFAAASLEQGTADAFYANLTDDALQLSANGAPVQGRAAIREHLRPLGMQVLSWTPQKAAVAASLDLGWTWGEWRLLASARSGKELARGKYVNIWQRDAAGQWKVAVDMGNTATPPPDDAAGAPPAVDAPATTSN
ncbi:MAG: hypothetical protein JWR16_2730 [Nevskia sp.]|nr:hypothetical protein [Nevskia sp.]